MIFLMSTFSLMEGDNVLGTLPSSLAEDFRLLPPLLLSGLVFIVMLFWAPESEWVVLRVIAGGAFFIYTMCLLLCLLPAVGRAVVGCLIIGWMLSIVLPSMQEVVWGIIIVGIVALMIIKYGVWHK